jgi:hypothetical protein
MKTCYIVLIFLICLSCSKEDSHVKRRAVINIVEVSVPDSANAGKNVNIYAKAEAYNVSYRDLYIDLRRETDFKYSLKAYATYESYGVTADWLISTDTIIGFTPTLKGKYFFEVWTSPKNSYTGSMVVN